MLPQDRLSPLLHWRALLDQQSRRALLIVSTYQEWK
jgi:hypothetical protein